MAQPMQSNSSTQQMNGQRRCWEHCWLRKPPRGPENPTVENDLPVADQNDFQNRHIIYKPLHPWQTRIIRLLPDQPGRPLRCEIILAEFVDLDGVGIPESGQIVQYEAVSYSWGKSKLRTPITCNGLSYSIGHNLATALSYLRSPLDPRYLWCDALCIDQENSTEKSQQVSIMLRIFEKALRVIAWLGLLRNIGPKLTDYYAESPLVEKGLSHTELCYHNLKLLGKSVGLIYTSDWFRRTWVRQEVFAAKELIIQFGHHCVEFQRFRTLNTWLLDLAEEQDKTRSYIPRAPGTAQILAADFGHKGTDRHDYKPPGSLYSYSFHWVKILLEGKSFGVTNERDRVYGLVGMLQSRTNRWFVKVPPNIQSLQFPVDYAKSISQIYQDVVKYLINTTRTLDVLWAGNCCPRIMSDLPTWVFDWRQGTAPVLFDIVSSSVDRKRLAPIQDLDDYGQLTLEGAVLGQIGTLRKLTKHWLDELDPVMAKHRHFWTEDKMALAALDEVSSNALQALGLVGKKNSFRDCTLIVTRGAKLDDLVVHFRGRHGFCLLRKAEADSRNPRFYFLGSVYYVGLNPSIREVLASLDPYMKELVLI